MSRGLANKKQDSLLQGFDKSGSIGNTVKGKEIGGRGGGGGVARSEKNAFSTYNMFLRLKFGWHS